MNDIEFIKQNVETIVESSKIETLEFVEEDKLEIKLLLNEDDNEKDIKDRLLMLLKVELKIPKVRYSFEIKKQALILDNAKKIIVSSGKGGVGKSSVSAKIAKTLSNQGKKVAVIDADIYGSSIPTIFGLEGSPTSSNNKINPLKYENIELIGTTNVNPNNEPVVWRGPMLGRLLKGFFNDVNWSADIDYLLIDLPPGTGDVPLDLNMIIPDAKCIVVTTPHINASKVAIKAGEFAKMQKHELIGVVENMSYYNHNGEHLYIFGKDGGKYVADALDSNVITQIPIVTTTLLMEDEEEKNAYNDIVKQIENSFKK